MTFNRRFGVLPILALLISPLSVLAGGARWYTGPPFYTGIDGIPVVFFTSNPLYYTDAGDLNANVNHEQADAMVAAAAAVWNVPTSLLTLAQGGTLVEHVSGGNTYFDGTQMVWPDDVQLANYRAKPIAIVYDTDGSVIDTLLGSGASETAACRQNGVVESVDGLDPDGTIHHALLILNGRCVGANADQLMQMRYQLTRAFGRILGLAWSQLNDNVFTGTPTPTLAQALNWPLMHPIDVICGPYTYKCMAQPFTLRPDDLSALALLYPVTSANITSGKTLSSDGAEYLLGKLMFPTDQGMDAANIVVKRASIGNALEDTELVSAVTGMGFQQVAGNPVSGAASGAAESNGKSFFDAANEYIMRRIPLPNALVYVLSFTAESINPLYTGEYAVGPYRGQPTSLSGPAFAFGGCCFTAGQYDRYVMTDPQAATSCNPGNDGSEDAPATPDASGFWSGQLCASRHTSWWSQSVQAGRTWTVEVSATDENGVVSASKAHPLIGVWNATDARGGTPTVGATQSPFNAQTVGMTQLKVNAASAAATLRIAVADERGHGRPDFGYKMRVLYADGLIPTQLGASGGRITITGEGFRTGNRVTVNGVTATVVSWSANTIIATAPTRSAAHMTASGNADVAVIDASTGGSTVMQAALSYGGTSVNTLTLVSAPTQLDTGAISSTPIAVRVMAADGVTALAGASVRFAVTAGAATFAACGVASCTLTTDSGGYARSSLTATAAGALMLLATEISGGASVQASVSVTDPVRLIALVSAPAQLVTGTAAGTPFAVRVTGADGVTAVAGAHVQLVSTGVSAIFAACGAAGCTLTTDASGNVSSVITANAAGVLVLAATEASGGASVQANVTVSDPMRLLTLVSAPTQVQTGVVSAAPLVLRVTAADGATPVAGATVRVTVSSGSATFAACGAATCTLTADRNGYAQSAFTAGSAGTLVLTAIETQGGTTVQASVTASEPAPRIALVSAPTQVQVGQLSSPGLLVRVTAADGLTAVAGASVRFTVTSGLAMFAACGAATCTLATDANGYTQSIFTPNAAGALVLTAMELRGGAAVQANVAVIDPVRTVSIAGTSRYLAAGATVQWVLSLDAIQNGAAANGVPVAWSAGPGLFLGAVSSVTDTGGTANVSVLTPGLAAGVQATVQGCAWGNVCASNSVVGVGDSEWTLSVAGGANQSVAASATLSAVTLRVTDAAGHALEGATVTIYQTVDGWEGPCPARGRCAAAPVLTSSQTTAVSGADGSVTITPLEVAGVASVVHVAAVTGTQGFVSLALKKVPE